MLMIFVLLGEHDDGQAEHICHHVEHVPVEHLGDLRVASEVLKQIVSAQQLLDDEDLGMHGIYFVGDHVQRLREQVKDNAQELVHALHDRVLVLTTASLVQRAIEVENYVCDGRHSLEDVQRDDLGE